MYYKIKVTDKKEIDKKLLEFLDVIKMEIKPDYFNKNVYINEILTKVSVYNFKVKNPKSQDLISLKETPSSNDDTHLINSSTFNIKDIVDFSINAKFARLYNLFDYVLKNETEFDQITVFNEPELLKEQFLKFTEVSDNDGIIEEIDEMISYLFELFNTLKELVVIFYKKEFNQNEQYTMNKQKAINICFEDDVEVGYIGVSTGFMLKMQNIVKDIIDKENDLKPKDRKGQLRYKRVPYMNNEAKKQNLSVKMPYIYSTLNFEVKLNKNSNEYLWEDNEKKIYLTKRISKNFKWNNRDILLTYKTAIKHISGVSLKNYVESIQEKIVFNYIDEIVKTFKTINVQELNIFERSLLIREIDELLFSATNYNRGFIIEFFLKKLNLHYLFNNDSN